MTLNEMHYTICVPANLKILFPRHSLQSGKSKVEYLITLTIIMLCCRLPLNELANMLNSRETVHGSTAFFKACSMGRRDVVKCFVEAVKFLGPQNNNC